MSDTHNQQILRALKKGIRITQPKAWRMFRCGRLAPRICELRKEGWPIKGERAEDANFYEYWLARKRKAA